MNFTLINNNNTTKILDNLKQFNFKTLNIVRKEQLTFVEIEDNRFCAYVKRDTENYFVLHIYKRFIYKINYDISFLNIWTIDYLEM